MIKKLREHKWKKIIEKSGLFDYRYYLFEYPDVRAMDIDPIIHYIRHGAQEFRNPSDKFDTKFYIESNEGVDFNEINPLVHYILHGKKFGKKAVDNLNEEEFEELLKNLQKEFKNGKIILVFPIISWHFRWQRPQQIFSRLAKKGYKIIYLSNSFYKNKLQKLDENIYELSLKSRGFNIYEKFLTLEKIEEMYSQIKRVIDNIDLSNDLIYFVQFPNWLKLIKKLKKDYNGKIIFDCMDEHSGFDNIDDFMEILEEELFELSDKIIVSSNKLYTKAIKYNKNVYLVKNGTDYEFFSKQPKELLPNNIKKPIIGYYGAISSWFDVDIIEYCAKNRPNYNFVLIGAVNRDIIKLEKLSNVFLLGEKKYEELPKYLYNFDVCLIPFKLTPLIEATNPVKFYEYISAKKPVVSTMLPELKEYENICYLTSNKEEFLDNIDKALEEKNRSDYKELLEKREKVAKENSWDERVNIIERIINE